MKNLGILLFILYALFVANGSKITWEHNKCTNAVNYTTRGGWWTRFNFADYLSFDEYKIMVKNRAGVGLIEKIK